ncbi:HEAT repeat domain-containing protein [Streptomyces sp. NPDC017529]|uniref:HEAT repeat domain-containing protein n=1 Tax=Streptomyces sp. NPDC017529 TaxID=3365000 RepID=UPI0037B6756C
MREALLGLMSDPDAEVRQRACQTVADGHDRDPAFADAMAGLLDDEIRAVRVAAVYGLARHDDERCVEGDRHLPPAPPGTPYEYDLDEVWRYEMRRDGRAGAHGRITVSVSLIATALGVFALGSRKPEAGSRKPEAGSRKPEAGSHKAVRRAVVRPPPGVQGGLGTVIREGRTRRRWCIGTSPCGCRSRRAAPCA